MPIFFAVTAREYKLRAGRPEEAEGLRILALDTTTAWGSAAVVDGAEILGEVRLRAASGHSHSVMPAVVFLLDALRIDPASLEGYAVACGPGSFTGLRIGIGTVQGLALASGRPCLGVCALDVVAERLRGASACLVAVMDAYRDEVYAGIYDSEARLQGTWQAETPTDLIARVPEEAAFAGDGALRYRDLILRLRPRASFPRRSPYLAGTLGLMAEPRLRTGEGVSAAELRPLYLRAPHIRPSGG
jgi:tRNA threonylcarbamoyladenosine biosynthesis protein TsaB